MKVVELAKTEIEALELAKNKLETENVIYNIEEVVEGKIFKSKMIKVTAESYEDLLEESTQYLKELLEKMGIEVNFETRITSEEIEITMYSDNNPILIGKEGRTLKSLELLLKTKLKNQWKEIPRINLDVLNYKEKRIESIERLAVKIAKEVRNTKIDATLDNMNSYERRIIHNKLANFKGVTTVSEGEEPNRHVIIKAN